MFSSKEEAREFVLEFFRRQLADEEIHELWRGLNTVVVVNISDFDIWVTIDSKNQDELVIKPGKTDPYELLMKLPMKTLHEIYTGQQGVVSAFAMRKIKTKGSVGVIMKTSWSLPKAIAIYKQLCSERGIGTEPKRKGLFGGKKDAKAKPKQGSKASGDRIERLRGQLYANDYGVCVERARYLTESFKATEGEPMVVRQAKALANILQKMSVNIYPDELIVGNITSKPIGAGVFPEFMGARILSEIDTLETRATNPFKLAEEDKGELQEIFSYWKGRTIIDLASRHMDPETKHVNDTIGVFILTEQAGISHVILNYPKILGSGFEGIRAEASAALEEAKAAGSTEKVDFYNSIIIVCDAIIEFADRHSRLANDMAAKERDQNRKAELQTISEVCSRACRKPATFREALQAVWFSQAIAHIESYEQGISLGRFDQYMLPFYERDVKEGRLDDAGAVELLAAAFVKMSQSIPLFDAEVTFAFEGMPTNQGLTIGGTIDGRDASNKLTYLVIDAIAKANTRQPNVHLRVHENTPRDLLRKAFSYLAKGTSQPSLFYDGTIVPALEAHNITRSDAENYGTVGCVEISVPYKTYGSTDAALFNVAVCLETALNGGRGRVLEDVRGVDTGDPREFASMDDVLGAFQRQLEHFVGHMCEGANALETAHQEAKPTPFMSAHIEGCMEAGRDIVHGSARLNFTGVQGVALAEVADSLAAIDQVVFQSKRATMAQLVEAMNRDFDGYEDLRSQLQRAPKFGNNDPLPDKYYRLAGQMFGSEVLKHTNPRGGKYLPGNLSMTTHRVFGMLTGALPSGRGAGEPLSNGIAPVDGRDNSGPTSMLQSVAKLDSVTSANGPALNIKFSPSVFKGDGMESTIDLVRTYFQLGGMHMQLNVVDRETLLDAKSHPEQYQDLIVRISGYCARFVDLSDEMKDEIIARTEFSRW